MSTATIVRRKKGLRGRGRRRARARWLITVLLAAVVLSLGLCARVALAQFPQHLERALARVLAVPFRIEGVDFGLWRGLVVRGLTIDSPHGSNFSHVLTVKELRVRVSYLNLLLGRSLVDTIVLEEPELFLEGCPDGMLTITKVFRPDAFPKDEDRRVELPALELHNLKLITCPETVLHLDDPLNVPRFQVTLPPSGKQGEFEVSFSLEHPDVRHVSFTGSGDASRGDFRGQLDVLLVRLEDNLRDRLPAAAHEAWDRVGPRGLASAVVQFALEEWRLADWRVELKVLDGALQLQTPPLTIESLGGTVEVTPRAIRTLDPLRGVVLKGAASLAGEILLSNGKPTDVDAQLQMDSVPLTTATRSIVADYPDFLSVWDAFSPNGDLSVAFSVKGALVDGLPRGEDVALTVTLKDVTAAHKEFTYPIHHIAGVITVKKNVLALDLRGSAGTVGSPVEVKGSAVLAVTGPVDVRVRMPDFVIDQRLVQARPNILGEFWRTYSPSGSGSGELRITRSADQSGPPEIVLAIWGQESISLTYRGFPYRIERISGTAEIDIFKPHAAGVAGTHRVVLSGLRGVHIPTVRREGVAGDGRSLIRLDAGIVEVSDSGSLVEIDLPIESPALLVDGDLMAAFSGDAAETVNDFGVEGSVATQVSIRRRREQADQPIDLTVTLEPPDIEAVRKLLGEAPPPLVVSYEALPYRLALKRGRATLDITRRIHRFADFETDGTKGPLIRFEGSLSPDEARPGYRALDLWIRIGAGRDRGLPLANQQLTANLPTDVRNFIERLQMSGYLTTRAELPIHIFYSYLEGIDGRPVDYVCEYAADLAGYDCSVNFGIQFSEINGHFSMVGSASPAEPHHFSCEATLTDARLSRLRAKDIKLRCTYGEEHPLIQAARRDSAPRNDLLAMDDALLARLAPERVEKVVQVYVEEGTLYGGPLGGFIYVDLGEARDYYVQMSTHDVDISRGSEDVFRRPGTEGIARGWVQMSGVTGDPDQIWGRGELHVVDGKLVDIPLAVAVISGLVNFSNLDKKYIEEVYSRFGIRRWKFSDGVIRPAFVVNPQNEKLDEWMVLKTPTLGLRVEGAMDFDQNLDMILIPEAPSIMGKILGLPFRLFGWLGVGQFPLYGPLDSPSVTALPTLGAGSEVEE